MRVVLTSKEQAYIKLRTKMIKIAVRSFILETTQIKAVSDWRYVANEHHPKKMKMAQNTLEKVEALVDKI